MREEHGVDMASHRSAMLSHADMFEATHIYCMTQRHHAEVLSLERRNASEAGPSFQPSHSMAAGAHDKENRGHGKENSSSSRAPPLVSVFNPEIPDPWRGTTECYRNCTEMIAEAVKKALDQEIAEISGPQQQQESTSVSRSREQDDSAKSQS